MNAFSFSKILNDFFPNSHTFESPVPIIAKSTGNYFSDTVENFFTEGFPGLSGAPNSWSEHGVITEASTNSGTQNTTKLEEWPQAIQPTLRKKESIKTGQKITGVADYRVFADRKFLVYVLDDNSSVIGVGEAVLVGRNTGNKFLSFEAKLSFNKPNTYKGYLLFRNAPNATYYSDVLVPIYFADNKFSLPPMIFSSSDLIDSTK